jgi:hypothetical protein
LALGVACAAASAVLCFSASARADVSSWVYAGFGLLKDDTRSQRWTLQLEAGMGTAPAPFVLGGLVRAQPIIGLGTDLALLARGAMGSFVRGDFGLALDVGAYRRFWGEGSTGGTASLVLGAPWGITCSITGGYGTNDTRFGSVTLGLDFARLTVYRTTGQSWFKNPFVTDERGRGPR